MVLAAARLQSLIADVSFPVQYNLPITLTATATGLVEYKFMMYSSSAGWRVGQEYSTNNTFTWYPPVGLNAVQVWMRTSGSTRDYEDWLSTGLFTVAGAPAVLTGFAMAFARAIGEYGSVVFISGNMPFKTEITPLLIITKLEQYDYAGATGIACVMLMVSFALLLLINGLQHWSTSRTTG